MPSKYHMKPTKARFLLRKELARTRVSSRLLKHASPIMIETLWQRWKNWDVDSAMPRDSLRKAVFAGGVIWIERLDKAIAALTEIIEETR